MTAIKRIAIVNRGDAALRCLRAIRELRAEEGSDLVAIAIYTEPEHGAPFVRLADEALSLGPPLRGARGAPPRPAYLDRARVLAALRATHADAVWPGWGFLAEDATFVEMLEGRGITFLGPSSTTIRALGDKIAAKQLAERVAVPVAPWSGGTVSETSLQESAAAIGFPLLIKASAGGGGRGIRLVGGPADLPAAFASATSEAAHAFGDGRVFLEALVRGGRHIEVQIAADQAGRCLALGLRDCSVQRRHQKIIEEAPPPHLSPEIERALRHCAVRLAAAANYRGVGTVEFLLGPDGREFYFLEINPRLQVEHGLTESLTGIDLVKLQIRIARGEPLPPEEPVQQGHAIEARVCAEDPDRGFMPAPGRVVRMDLPAGTGVRVDCGIGLDSTVPPEFDPLIAKVIAHGPTREAARARLACALAEFRLVIAGGATNKGSLLDLLESDDLRAGGVDVDWLTRRGGSDGSTRYTVEALMVAAILTYLEERSVARLNFLAEAGTGLPSTIPPSTGQVLDFTYRGEAYRVGVLALGDWRYRIQLDGRECVATLLDQELNACQLVVGSERLGITYTADDSGLRIEVEGRPHVIGRQTGGQVRASAPSVVIAVDVSVGDTVSAGQRLGLLETMKIEISFSAPLSGTVKEITIRPNQRVAAGDVLLVIEPGVQPAATGSGARLQLPAWSDPLEAWFGAGGKPAPELVSSAERTSRERAVSALMAETSRLLLGFDVDPDESDRLLRLLESDLLAGCDPHFADELAQIRHAVRIFADTEALFSRAPEEGPDGTLGPSNDARMRMYLRRIGIRGAGIADSFLARLRRTLAHYGIKDLTPSEALERALLRLFAAANNREERHRLAQVLLRLLSRLATASAELREDRELLDALGTCAMLRGQVPDALADSAAEARYAIFEQPRIRAEAAAAAEAVQAALQGLGGPDSPVLDLETLGRIADSPAPIFDRIVEWTAEGDQQRRDVALQALVLRRYAPFIPVARHVIEIGGFHLSRLQFPDRRVVLATVAPPEDLPAVWRALHSATAEEANAPLLELMLTAAEPVRADHLRGRIAGLAREEMPIARRICVTALQPGGGRLHVVYERTANGGSPFIERTDLFGVHPETARRLELQRLAEFQLERLPAAESVYAFFGRSRSIPDDERFFVLAEARAAAPGPRGGLHEGAFVRIFYEAVHTLHHLRSERDPHRRLNWNRITIFVRPEMFLLPETVQRMGRELRPAMRHLGLEKLVVRLALRDEKTGSLPARSMELVVEPGAGGRVDLSWREPHHAPLRPVTRDERRIAQARRRGLIYPSEVIRLFTGASNGNAGAGAFEEFDLDPYTPQPLAVSVRGRPPGENRSGIVFGLVTSATEKHPEGMQRVLVVSDPTVDMGALAGPECDRLVAALDLAEQKRVPVEWVAVSSGARIAMDSGTENLDATARVVRRIVTFTQAGGEINVIVPGINVGAQSYFDALATMLMHTRGILVMTPSAAMVLTGRRALEASGSVAAEDEVGIGGFERIMGPSGQAQYYARDLTEAHHILLEHYRFTYVPPGETRPRRHATTDPAERPFTEAPYGDSAEGFESISEIFDDRTNPGRKRPFAMRPVMQALIDRDGGWLERWKRMAGAETAIVWDAHVGGHPVCLIGIESRSVPRLGHRPTDGPDQWLGGTLFPLSSKKVARALTAASGNRPVVLLANLSGFDGSPESMRKLQLEYGAEIAQAVVNFDGPILFVVVSRYHGGAYVVFSRSLNDNLTALAFEGSYASVIGGGPAATVVFAREVQARTDGDPRVVALRERLAADRSPETAGPLREQLDRLIAEVALEKHGEIAREFDAVHSVHRAREVGSLDAIIPPERLRSVVIDHLDAALETTRSTRARRLAPLEPRLASGATRRP